MELLCERRGSDPKHGIDRQSSLPNVGTRVESDFHLHDLDIAVALRSTSFVARQAGISFENAFVEMITEDVNQGGEEDVKMRLRVKGIWFHHSSQGEVILRGTRGVGSIFASVRRRNATECVYRSIKHRVVAGARVGVRIVGPNHSRGGVTIV